MQVSDVPVLHVDWGYDANNVDRECLIGWANTNNLALLHNLKDAANFISGRWNTSTNPNLAFVSIDPISRLPNRYVLEKFPRSQHRPSLITPPRFARPVPSKPVKRWNFRKAKWSHYITLSKILARTLPPPDMDQAYQCFCHTISTAAEKYIARGRRNNRKPCWDAECENFYQTFLHFPEGHDCNTAVAELIQLCLPGLTGDGGIDGLRLYRTSTFHTLAG